MFKKQFWDIYLKKNSGGFKVSFMSVLKCPLPPVHTVLFREFMYIPLLDWTLSKAILGHGSSLHVLLAHLFVMAYILHTQLIGMHTEASSKGYHVAELYT